MDNHPPNVPTIEGEKTGKKDVEYEYRFNTTDPDNNNVKYFIDWGDGKTMWTDFYPSSTEIKLKHRWKTIGTYTIRAKAQDTFGAESGWAELEISMPKNHHFWFIQLLERMPHFNTIFKFLLVKIMPSY
jgi:hypothetical protein